MTTDIDWYPTESELDEEDRRLADDIRRDNDPRCAVCHGIHSWFMCPIDDSAAQIVTTRSRQTP